MTSTGNTIEESSALPASASDFLAFTAQGTGVSVDILKESLDSSSVRNTDLLEIVWMQSSQNMALLATVVALASDDSALKRERIEELIAATQTKFLAMSEMSGALIRRSMDEYVKRGGFNRE